MGELRFSYRSKVLAARVVVAALLALLVALPVLSGEPSATSSSSTAISVTDSTAPPGEQRGDDGSGTRGSGGAVKTTDMTLAGSSVRSASESEARQDFESISREAATTTTAAATVTTAATVPVPAVLTNFLASECAATVDRSANFHILPGASPRLLLGDAFADPDYEPPTGSRQYRALALLGVTSAQELRDLGRTVATQRFGAWTVGDRLRWADPDEPSCAAHWTAAQAILPRIRVDYSQSGNPRNLAVSAEWLVTWDAPTSGRQPDLYRVEVAFATSTYEYELDTTSLSLDIVRKVEAHPLEKFTVRARSDNGLKDGAWTDALSFTAPAVLLPGPPTSVALAAVLDTWVVTWSAPESGGPVQKYYVQLNSTSTPGQSFYVDVGTALSYEVTYVLRYMSSEIALRMRAWNEAGFSTWTEEQTITNPASS